MMTLRGHTVIHYGHEDSDVQCTEHVNVLSRQDYNRVYGEHDFRSKLFKFDQSDDAYTTFNTNAIREINLRKQPSDFLLAFWGSGHQIICQGAGEGMCVVEPGIGYPYGHFAEYKIFESYAMYHAFIKLDRVAQCVDINTWSRETVIPNYFDVSDFVDNVVSLKDRGDYFLFVGRIGSAKGVDHAIRMTERLGVRLIIAGQNAEDGLKEVGMFPPPGHVEVIGHVDVDKRKTLMANAKAVVCMSTFAEPFCGVHVEAMMSGTPVITADWGAFTEFNVHGVTGFRCRTLEQMVDAGRRIHEIDPMTCRKWAFDNFSTPVVAKKYEDFFQTIMPKTTRKVAVWCETKWALGRIGNAIKKYIPNVDIYNWGSVEDNSILWASKKWKEYDAIISNTTLHTLKQLYGFEPSEEMLRRFVVIAHCPRFEGMSYFKETLDGHSKLSRYGGVSQETCLEMKKYGVDAAYVPFGADTDVFPLTHKVTGPIQRLGIIGELKRASNQTEIDEYSKIKGFNMFSDICVRGGFESVEIFGREGTDMYSNIDALICCSELEGGPLGIFEAASCGIPVLTRRVGNAQYVKGIATFDTAEEALQILASWNKNVEALRDCTNNVTNEVRTNWSMQSLITRHLLPLVDKSCTEKNDKIPYYYFYTSDYVHWHNTLKNTLEDYFDVRPILIDKINGLHDQHSIHHWVGCSEKIKLLIDCIRQNIGKRIVFSDVTIYVNPNKVKELYSLVCNASSGMTFARNAQLDEINICFMTVDCTHETLQIWEEIMGKIGPSDHDQYIVNCVVKNPQLFEAHEVIARWPVDVSTWYSYNRDSFIVLKIFTPSNECKTTRDGFRYSVMKDYGYPILP
jgi:glycosyltransferase involved in cell wall biosynthesis